MRTSQTPKEFGSNCVVRLDARARYAILKDRNVRIRTVKDSAQGLQEERRTVHTPKGLLERHRFLKAEKRTETTLDSYGKLGKPNGVVNGGTNLPALQLGVSAPPIVGTQQMSSDAIAMTEMKLLRKEVIQPHLPVRLPCYDFTPIANPTFGSSLSKS